jgi:hypothetical protein
MPIAGMGKPPSSMLSSNRLHCSGYSFVERFTCPRADFERALRISSGATAPALALLELLVDHLAADDDALAVSDLLSEGAAVHPEMRGLLVMAAAHPLGCCPKREPWLFTRYSTPQPWS